MGRDTGRQAGSGRWVRRGDRILVLASAPTAHGGLEMESGSGAPLRILIFYGYSGAPGDGTTERDTSNLRVAETLKEHLSRRFPGDRIDLVCAWHKNTFVRALLVPPSAAGKIRQIHYVGHGSGGGLYFGYKHPVAAEARNRAHRLLNDPAGMFFRYPDRAKRVLALTQEAGLLSGYFTDALAPDLLRRIRSHLAPDAMMHVWGCFAGAPTHTFDSDPYWNLFNSAGTPVHGIARHIAVALGIPVTAGWAPGGIHGMSYSYRDARGVFTENRPGKMPQWLWPASSKVRWVTYDSAGNKDENRILFLGRTLPAADISPGKHPPSWFTREIPVSRAAARGSAFPACSAVPVTL